MYKSFLHTHVLVVTLFLLLYAVKTILLLSNKHDLLEKFKKKTKVFEMVISTLFLVTGVFLLTQLPFGSKYDYLLWIKIGMVLLSIPLAVIGFKKGNKLLAALSLLLITGSYGLAEVYGKRKNITNDSAVASNDGKELYEANCRLCHGSDGKAMLAGANDLSITVLEKNDIKTIILNGRNAMAKVNVNEVQADAIADYVLSTIKGH
jgi:uncharacterized membrane protein SirB2/cytochrome c5